MHDQPRWRSSGVEPVYQYRVRPDSKIAAPVHVGWKVRPIGTCFHCNDETEAGDDPYPDLCAMCAKAGRRSALQAADEEEHEAPENQADAGGAG